MSPNTPQGELRPSVTSGDPLAEPFVVPLLRLRGHDRPVIGPEDCRLGPSCLVCAWRRAGLLDPPAFAPKTIVREPDSGYWVCPSSFCPGCERVRCLCPPAGHEDALAEAAYTLGFEHGLADGPENRPTRRWLVDAGLDPERYLDGYDAACASVAWPGEDAVEAPR